MRGSAHQFDQARQGVLTVTVLGAKALCGDNQYSLCTDTSAGERGEPFPYQPVIIYTICVPLFKK
jgi:hypothetical protein